MRGLPLLRAALTLCALLALGWPLQVITRPAAENVAGPATAPVSDAVSKLPLKLTFSRTAKSAELLYSGKRVWFAEKPGVAVSLSLDLPFPKEGIELEARVEWEGEEQSALRLQLVTPEGDEIDRSVWGQGALQSIVPFP
jgi:hypothetical protein